jgi:hypothetical protein
METETLTVPLERESQKKFFATIDNPLIVAIIEERFRFDDAEHALNRLKQIRKKYQIVSHDHNSVTLWIKGFAISKEQERKGYLGNYACLYLKPVPEKGITLAAEPILLPLAEHPLKKRPQHKHPNWAHPIMRSIKKQQTYTSIPLAQEVLDKLHSEFPDTTIPASYHKLYIHLYSKDKERTLPIQKVVLKIVPVDAQGERIQYEDMPDYEEKHDLFRIDWKENTGRSKKGGGMKAAVAAMAAGMGGR